MHASQDGAPFGFAASAHSRPSWASCCRVWPARGLVGTAGTTVHAATARTATITRDERMTPPPALACADAQAPPRQAAHVNVCEKSPRRLPRRASTYRMPPAMNIVDSQVHIWGPDTPQH